MAMAETVGTDIAKLRELTLYICRKSEGDDSFGSVKLNKLLFLSDFTFYTAKGKAITGQEYQKLESGPAPRIMPALLREMDRDGDLKIADRQYCGRPQKRPFAFREPDLSVFTGEEIAVVDAIVEGCRGMHGRDIRLQSHRFVGWQLAQIGETIPYSSTLLEKRELTPQELKWAEELDFTGVSELLAS